MIKALEIRHCRVLVALADSGGVAAAARSLGLSQSTVSETVLSLERLTETPILLRRRGMEASLTPAAEALLPHARTMIAASEAALASVSPRHRRVLRLGAIESLSSYQLPQALASVRSRGFDIDVQVTTGICQALRQMVRIGELDAAITLESPDDDGAADRTFTGFLGNARIAFIAAEPVPKSISKSFLASRRILVPDPEGAVNRLVEQWLSAWSSSQRLESTGSVDGVKRGVWAGGAVGVLPTYSVVAEVASGALFEVEPAVPLPEVSISVTAQRSVLDDRPFRELTESLQVELARGSIPTT